MRNLSEVEAAEILGEIARERVQTGHRPLTEGQGAQILRAHRQVRSLPEVSEQPAPNRIPRPRRASRLRALR
jgi:hypothetical protein